MRSIEGKLHAILDDCSDPLYRLIADDEARVRTVIRDLVNTQTVYMLDLQSQERHPHIM